MENKAYIADVIFIGRVQGVGFRFKCYKVAAGYEVSGYVQNLADGTVHLIACGKKSEVEDFVSEIKRVMSPFIRSTQEKYDYGENKIKSFDIR